MSLFYFKYEKNYEKTKVNKNEFSIKYRVSIKGDETAV